MTIPTPVRPAPMTVAVVVLGLPAAALRPALDAVPPRRVTWQVVDGAAGR